MKTTVEAIPESKIKSVKELSDLIKNKKTILFADISNIPGSQFQQISKKLRGKAIVKVPKRNLFLRALDSAKGDKIKELKEQFKGAVALLFSDLDSYELAALLVKNKSPAKAKQGQIAPEDLEVPEGPTELIPGPAISELGALGIQIQIKGGKIEIKQPKVVTKQGKEISQGAADILSKLNIKPFSIGFIPLSAYDSKENTIYLDIKINTEETVQELVSGFSKALAFSVEIGYANSETITFMIQKAAKYEKALESLSPKEEVKEEKTEEKVEEEKPAEETQTPEDKTGEENK